MVPIYRVLISLLSLLGDAAPPLRRRGGQPARTARMWHVFTSPTEGVVLLEATVLTDCTSTGMNSTDCIIASRGLSIHTYQVPTLPPRPIISVLALVRVPTRLYIIYSTDSRPMLRATRAFLYCRINTSCKKVSYDFEDLL
jgi:hypothetical protein